MKWETWTPRQRRRAIHGGAGVGAFLLHLGLLLVLKPDPHFRDPPELIIDNVGPPPMQVVLIRPKPPSPDPRRAATESRGRESLPRAAAPVAGPVKRIAPTGPPSPAPPPAAPAGAATPGRNLGRQAASPGVNWGQAPADAAARRALRASVGCEYGIALTRAEQDRCDERMGRDRLKPDRRLPLMADRRRQAEFDREAAYKDRLQKWKDENMPAGTNIFGSELGSQPPEK